MMWDKFEGLTNKEKIESFQKLKSKYAKLDDMFELIKVAHKIFFIYVNYCLKKMINQKTRMMNMP